MVTFPYVTVKNKHCYVCLDDNVSHYKALWYMAKLHIVDGFYRVWILPVDIVKIGIVFPQSGEEEPSIGFPLALPIGWVNSPPYFTADTETKCRLANDKLNAAASFPAHRLDEIAESCP
jgi:hypothetical protein